MALCATLGHHRSTLYSSISNTPTPIYLVYLICIEEKDGEVEEVKEGQDGLGELRCR